MVDRRWAITSVVRPPHQRLQSGLHVALACGVQRRGRLVQYQHSRLVQDDAGYGQPLPLAAGQPEAPLADDGVVAFGQLHYAVVDVGCLRCIDQLMAGGVGPGVEQVPLHGGMEQVALLGHVADAFREVGQTYLPHVNAVDAHRALGYVVQGAAPGRRGWSFRRRWGRRRPPSAPAGCSCSRRPAPTPVLCHFRPRWRRPVHRPPRAGS